VAPPAPHDLLRHVCTTTGLPPGTAERVIADVIAYFGETAEEYVRRRHDELHQRQYRNPQIWPLIAAELTHRPVAAPGLSQRQLRRIVYG
jgi:tRNA(His) 5'-end guanylyltransferase